MKILFITDLYPVSFNEKTTPKTLLNFVTEWENSSHHVDIIKPNFILNSFIRKKPFYRSGQYGKVLNINFWTPFLGKIKQPKKTYDIIVAHMPSGILYADKLNMPFIAGIHNSDIEILTNPLYKFYFKNRHLKALRNSQAIACRSHVIEKKLLKLFPEFKNKTFTALSGIDYNYIQQKQNYDLHNPIKVLTCANYKKTKHIEEVLKALNNLEGFTLTVIGNKTDTTKLHKLNSQAVFKGFLPHKEVLKEMQNSDVFILPSEGETFGMVYLEAMASGCITVCCENDGIDGIIENNNNGFTVKPNLKEIQNLLLKIKNFNENDRKLLLDNAFATITKLNSKDCSENYLQQILRFCKDLT